MILERHKQSKWFCPKLPSAKIVRVTGIINSWSWICIWLDWVLEIEDKDFYALRDCLKYFAIWLLLGACMYLFLIF